MGINVLRTRINVRLDDEGITIWRCQKTARGEGGKCAKRANREIRGGRARVLEMTLYAFRTFYTG